MHDPMTVAFDLKYPWFRRGAWPHRWSLLPAAWRSDRHWPDGYRETFATIWHRDPERHGSDDSCGWSRPPLTDADRAYAKRLADWEEGSPYFFAMPVIKQLRSYASDDDPGVHVPYWSTRISAGDCVALVATLFDRCRWELEPKHRRRWGLTPKLMAAAFALGASEGDNLQASFVLTDWDRSTPTRRREKIEAAFLLVIGAYRRATRPWYRHPRWHVHHWKLQVHPIAQLKRWLFTRCATCGQRFPWGAAVCTTSWHGTGPRWFRGEAHAYHQACVPTPNVKPAPAAEVSRG